jgi:hypothetical protein
MSSITDLLTSIEVSANGLTLAELLTGHPDIARRTAQRLIAKLIENGQITALSKGRARRYVASSHPTDRHSVAASSDSFPSFIPLSADSRDILSYIDQSSQARKPVGYQRDFLDAYRPNETGYLSESLCRQLHKMGRTIDVDEPAGTYSRASQSQHTKRLAFGWITLLLAQMFDMFHECGMKSLVVLCPVEAALKGPALGNGTKGLDDRGRCVLNQLQQAVCVGEGLFAHGFVSRKVSWWPSTWPQSIGA